MALVIDISHTITQGMPVYPGAIPPLIRQATTVANDGFAEKSVSIYTHTGTHIDAPAHMLEAGPTLDQFGAGHFVGTACVVDTAGRTLIDREFF